MCLEGLPVHNFKWILQVVHSTYFDHINPPNLPTLCLLCLNLSCMLPVYLGRVAFHWSWDDPPGPTLLTPATWQWSFTQGWDFVTTCSLLCWGFVWLGCVQVLCVLWQPQWVHVCMCPAVFGENGFLAVTHCLWLLSSFCFVFWDAPQSSGGGAVVEIFHLVLITKLLWRRRLTQRRLTIVEGRIRTAECPALKGTIYHTSFWSLLPSRFFSFLFFPSPSPYSPQTHKQVLTL